MDNLFVEDRVAKILYKAGSRGIAIDRDSLAGTNRTLGFQLIGLSEQIEEIALRYVTPSSRKDVAKLLFDELGLEDKSTRRSVAQKWTRNIDHPVIEPLMQYNSTQRTVSLIRSMASWIFDERVVSTWLPTNETSGRIYCKDFNVQQLPIPGRIGLVADPGHDFIMMDYKAAELRVLAAYSEDPSLIRALSAEDIHSTIGNEVFPLANLSDRLRNIAKAVSFGIIFGQEAKGLAVTINSSVPEAQSYIDSYFERFPRVKEWIVYTQQSCLKKGFVTNYFGHTRKLGEYRQKSFHEVAKIKRIIINTLVQGTAASILKRAMIRVDDISATKIVATVHDSLLVQVPEKFEQKSQVELAMTTDFRGVPFPVTISRARTWGDAQNLLS